MPADRARSESGDVSSNAGIIRACDQCRLRKIRCDKESPCSNCRIAQRHCSSTGAGQKPKEVRQRVLISTQYERKIDQIEDRLAGIERLLRNLSVNGGVQAKSELPLHEPSGPATFSPSAAGDASSAAYDREELDSAFEGNSALSAHTAFASEFLEHAVERTSLRDLSPSMQAALHSLQQIVGMQNKPSRTSEVRFGNQKPLPRGSFRELPMPPLAAVIPVLREMKETPPRTFTLVSVCCFMAIEDFADACRQVYFALEDYSHATFIIVNAGLYYLFQEKAVLAGTDSAAMREYTSYYELCRDNLETGLSNLNLFLPPTIEYIEALLLGASYAIEVSRPSLAWQLNVTAAQLCQALGYHRASPTGKADGRQDPKDKTGLLFWFSYMLDRGLALRLGRASVIRDFDVTMPRTIGAINAPELWKEILQLWIRHAEVQGKIYEQLYSPDSLTRPVGERIKAAQALAGELKSIVQRAALARARSPSIGDEAKAPIMKMVMKSDEVSFLSSLTLVYRATPPTGGFPGTFSPECIETARAAMQSHQEAMRLMGSNQWTAASYIHWTILYAPFVPFVVVFCHIVETANTEDLQRLRDFIESLESVCSVSEGVEKLHRLFQVLYHVASLYLETKGQQQQDQDMAPIGNEFDVYLSALGFMPPEESMHSGTVGVNAAPPAAAASQTAQLGDWFSGNRYVMGLVEEDLSRFDPTAWTSGP